MTKEELEKEAEKWVKGNTEIIDDEELGMECIKEPQAKEAYLAGAEFGYNKANEWHYPSKGEQPKDEFPDEYTKSRLPSVYKRHYCLYLGDDDCVMGKYMRGLFWTVEGQYSLSEIVAWKEIVLPKGD